MSDNIWHDVLGARRWDVPDLNAEEARTRAAADAQETKLHTAGELDELQRQAYREGFERGHADGLRSGAEAAREHSQRIAALLEALADPLRQVDLAVERTLVSLALTMTKRLVREAAADPKCLEQLVSDAVQALREPDPGLQVHLHPEDREMLATYFAELGGDPPWQLLDDAKLEHGDVRVSTDIAEVDARLANRLQRLEAEMLGEI